MTDGNPSRRSAAMIGRQLPDCAPRASRKPQISAARRRTGGPEPAHTVGSLPCAATRRIIAFQELVIGESPLMRLPCSGV